MIKKKNICILTGSFPPDIGGPAVYVNKLIGEFNKRSVDVSVVCYANEAGVLKIGSTNITKVSRRFILPFRLCNLFFHAWREARYSHVVYAMNIFSVGLPGFLAARLSGRKIVVKIVGDYAWERALLNFKVKDGIDDFQSKKYSLPVNLLKWMQSFLAKRMDRIIVPSEYLKRLVIGWGVSPNKIVVIYNSPPNNNQPTTDTRDENVLLSIGRLTPWKGFDMLVELMPDLLRANPKFKLFIIGEGGERQQLQNKINELNLGEKVFLLGKLDHQQTVAYLRSAGMFLLNTHYEGLSHVILEAMQAKCPMVVSRVGGNPEQISDGLNGFLAAPDNKREWYEKIMRLFRDSRLRNGFADFSLNRLESFSLEKMMDQTTETLLFMREGGLSITNQKHKIIFIGTTIYHQPLNDSLIKKFATLQDLGDLAVLGYSPDGRFQQFRYDNTRFFLTPRLPVMIVRYLFMLMTNTWRLAQLVRSEDYNIVVAQSPYEALGAVFVKGKAKLIIEAHGNFDEFFFSGRRVAFAGVYKKVMAAVASFTLKRADVLRAVSSSMKEKLRQWAPDKPIVIFPTWTDLEVFLNKESIKNESDQQIIFAGNLQPLKGVHNLINAFAKLSSDFPKARMSLIGPETDFAYAAKLKKQVLDLNLSKKINFIGNISQGELANWMAGARVLVLPSYTEGLPRVVFEAMAAATPVIATRVGGIPDIINDCETGFLFEPGDEQMLVNHLCWLLNNKDLAQEMGRKGRIEAQTIFSKEIYFNNYQKLFELALPK